MIMMMKTARKLLREPSVSSHRSALALGVLLGFMASSVLCSGEPAKVANPNAPTFADVPYGDHVRQRLDFWAVPGEGPHPLLIYIHGGGWRAADKSAMGNASTWVAKGISVASVNYRYCQDEPLPAPVQDVVRALQFLRHKAPEWNIDPTRVAVMGDSAGGTSALYIGLHDDMAQKDSPDPIARESTRVLGVYATSPQTTLDPLLINAWIGESAASFAMFYCAVGASSYKDLMAHYKRYKPLYDEYSPINHVDANDPPVLLFYNNRADLPPQDYVVAVHHPMFALKFKERADAVGYTNCNLFLVDPRMVNAPSVTEFMDRLLRGK